MNCDCPLLAPIGPSLALLCGGTQLFLFMEVLENFLRRQCDLEDPCNRFQALTKFDSYYDFVVIGGGSAGATVAGRLADSKFFSVLLIEAGFDEPASSQVPAFHKNFENSDIDWRYWTEPGKAACQNQVDRKCYWSKGKVLGGTSSINDLVYLRGSKKDYDTWAHLGNPGWSYDEVLPFFLRSENNQQLNSMDDRFHGTGGPLTISNFASHPPISDSIIEASQEIGYNIVDLNGRNHTGFAFVQGLIRNGHRLSTSRAYLRPIRNYSNLHTMLGSIATRVIFNEYNRAIGVEFFRDGLFYRVGVRKEVIISGGAVNSPQILLYSGIGPTGELSYLEIPTVYDLPGVGVNLHDHVAYKLNVYVNETDMSLLNFESAMEYLLYRDGPLSQPGLNQVTGFINTKYANANDDNPDIQINFSGYEAGCAKLGMINNLEADKKLIQILPTVIRPKSRGYLRLRDKNSLSKPLIYPRYLTHNDDIAVLIEGIKFTIQLFQTQALIKHGFELDRTPAKGCEHLNFGSDNYWQCAVLRDAVPMNRPVGSCRMGPSFDPLSVVDSQLRVYGVQGVRIADSSIMPKAVSAPTTATAIMIGEKAAQMIISTYVNISVSRSGY